MIIKLSSTIKISLRRPITFITNSKYELTFYLPNINANHSINIPEGYRVREYRQRDKMDLLFLYNRCGFNFPPDYLDEVLSICLPGGVILVEHIETRTFVSTMMARHLATPEFPFGGRIDWLATDPGHRGKGLGKISATLATNHLIKLGYKNIFFTTQPFRLDALKIFISIGFSPTQQTMIEYDWDHIQNKIKW